MKQTYFKYIILHILLFLFSLNFYAQNNSSIWVKTSRDHALKEAITLRKHEVKKANYYQLDIKQLKAQLQNAPNKKNSKVSGIIVRFPNKEGKLQAYHIKEAPLFESSFQEKHPDMRCYIGKSVNNSGESIRFSITPQGFHGMTLSSNKSAQFIDPVTYGSKNYMIYTKSDLSEMRKAFECKYIDNLTKAKSNSNAKLNASVNANDGVLRTYQLALASTGEYSKYHFDAAGQSSGTDTEKKNAVKAAMVVTMNRVNGIFERDLSLTMTMIDNTNIIFLDGTTDPYTNNDGLTMLSENQSTIDSNIGTNNYDIGHVFSTGGGGIASLNSPCDNSIKAQGVTGLAGPVGDIFDVEYVAHEMGHQFGAKHTWSSNNGSCIVASPPNQQWSPTSSYEPGSGSTIMAYAGICAPDNVQSNGDDYFHRGSIQEIWANISSDNCDDESSAGNSAPTAIAGNDYTIPISTPYKLTGNSSDPDPTGTTTHTYTWEQYDLAISQGSISENNTTGPLVRSYAPSTNLVRYIPTLEDLRIFNGSTSWEKLASVPRNLNFQLTVRDNGSGGSYGQTNSDGMLITVVDTDGPFKVTSQNTTGISYPVGSTQTITWDVAGTNSGAINTSLVNIRLSIDGGLTYPTLLLSTANDGIESVTLPAGIAAPFCRIMVEANPSENIFFAINQVNFAIGYTITENCNQYSSSPNLSIPNDSPGSGMQGTSVDDTITIPDNGTITSLKVNVNLSHKSVSDLVIQLSNPDNSTFNTLWSGNCSGNSQSMNVLFEDGAPTVNCNLPNISGTYNPSSSLNVHNNLSSSGNWRLSMADFEPSAGPNGTLNSWYLDACITTITLNNPKDLSFENLKIIPNPNKGEFTIKLQNIQSEKLYLGIFDIRGRSLFNESYDNTSELNKNIYLSHLQSGMYILHLDDGIRKATRKIIIE
ncbi:reprolysin-like metallopeptidase [uncultured Algibacter sp.]|uniref:zinc-dependent metalloprotease n=1 Tax=uncultured Algibacter sp. TaxID=298659 RepID=UPI002611D95C|nr:zinc-dependent metalloprotease family protein [uncultured Algibacter sp.]